MLTRLPFTRMALWRTIWRAPPAAPPDEPHAGGALVEPRFEQLQQPLAGDALGARRLGVGLAELALEQAVDAPHLLLLPQLLAVVGEPRAAFLAVLARRIGAPLDGALVGEAFLRLEEELLAFAAGVAAPLG